MRSYENNLERLQDLLLLGYDFALLSVAVLLGIVFYVTEQIVSLTSIFVIILCSISLILFKTPYKKLGAIISLVGVNIFLLVYAIQLKSGYMLTILTLMFFLSAFILNSTITIILFSVDVIGIIIGLYIGRLTIAQPIDPEVDTYYANTITDLIPNLLLGFVLVLIIYKSVKKIINQQAEQYTLLQDTQARLITQEKIQSIQTLAGGIAHDYNNILTSILGNISLLKMDLKDSPDQFELVKDLEIATNQAKGLTKQLLNYAKGHHDQKNTVFNVNEVLIDTLGFILHGTSQKPHHHLEKDLFNIEGDQNQISQLIQNLIINSIQAIENGGEIFISTENIEIGKDFLNSLDNTPYILIKIRDTGEGIPIELVEKVFEPFYTTKTQGTGLGLSICKAITINHQGEILLDSEVGLGTTVEVLLPATVKEIELSLGTSDQGEMERFFGKVLLMDDQLSVRKTLEEMLHRFGFTVDSVPNGYEAVELYQKSLLENAAYDLLIFDLTVPGSMGGIETLNIIKQINPKVCAVVISGYSHTDAITNFNKYGFSGSLEKPFEFQKLGNLLNDLKCMGNTKENIKE